MTRWWARVTRAPDCCRHGAPLDLGWPAWGRIFARSIDGAMRDDLGIVASSIAFAAFLSLLPLLSLVAVIYGIAVPARVVEENISTLVTILPGSAQQFVRSWLSNSLAQHDTDGLALLLSTAVTLFGARRAGLSLVRGMNIASGIERERSPISSQLAALAVVAVCAAMLLAALLSISAMTLLEELMPEGLTGAAQGVRALSWIVLSLGPAAALMLAYRYAAARRPVPWAWVWPGAMAAMLLWLCSTVAFRMYVSRVADYASIYGSLSAVIVLELWLMLSAFIFLLGAKVNSEAMRTAGVAALVQNKRDANT